MVTHFGVVIERILWAFVFDYFYTSFFFPFNIAFELLIIQLIGEFEGRILILKKKKILSQPNP